MFWRKKPDDYSDEVIIFADSGERLPKGDERYLNVLRRELGGAIVDHDPALLKELLLKIQDFELQAEKYSRKSVMDELLEMNKTYPYMSSYDLFDADFAGNHFCVLPKSTDEYGFEGGLWLDEYKERYEAISKYLILSRIYHALNLSTEHRSANRLIDNRDIHRLERYIEQHNRAKMAGADYDDD
jgi:hypothetical protein